MASLVSFIDGLPFKPGYRRYKIQTVEGVDDFASIREVVTRRFPPAVRRRKRLFPDILLIDGGKGQLNAALEAFEVLGIEPPTSDLAGQARGGDLSARRGGAAASEPAHARRCGCCSTCATRPIASPSTITTSCGARSCRMIGD